MPTLLGHDLTCRLCGRPTPPTRLEDDDACEQCHMTLPSDLDMPQHGPYEAAQSTR